MRTRTIRRALLALALSTSLTGVVVANAVADGMHDGTTGGGSSGTGGTTMPMPATHDAPARMSVRLVVTKDPKMGHNVNVRTNRFTWAPWNASTAHVDGQGHAHLYVDGKKITRLYGPWYFLGDLAKGRHVIKVTLNGNDHADYVRTGAPLTATQVVTVG